MGQELSSQLGDKRVSILEPLDVSVVESPVSCAQRRAQLEEEQMERVIDPTLLESIMALTEIPQQTSMTSNEMRSTEEEAEMERLRREAEQDFKEWKAARKRMRILRQHDSSTSTASSAISPLGYNHTYIS